MGLLLDTFMVPAWVDHMLMRIDDSISADVSLLVMREHASSARGTQGPRNPLRRRLLQMIEQHGAPAEGSALTTRSIEGRYAHVPLLRLNASTRQPGDPIAATDAGDIRAHELDVLLCIDSPALPEEGQSLARYGAWSLVSGDGCHGLNGGAGFREVLRGEPVTEAVLKMYNGIAQNGLELARTSTPTHATLVALNRETLLWGALSLVPRQLDRLYRCGPDALEQVPDGQSAGTLGAGQITDPADALSIPQLSRHWLRLFLKRLQRSLHYRLFEKQWYLCYAFEDSPSYAFEQFQTLMPGRDRYWADPMPVFHEGRWHIFFEDFPYASDQGHISVISFDEYHQPQPARDVLKTPYHLSYPFIFSWDDRLWMIPETADNNTVEIYECVSFPDQWVLRRRLLEDRYIVDATLHRHGDTWYLFANEVQNPGASSWTEAFLFINEGDLLDGTWKTHPDSPIRSDVSCARPAGPLFREGNVLLRPSQDCSIRYGGAMTIHEITEMSPERYAERVVRHIRPAWEPGLRGTHTYSHRPGLTVIDAVREVPRSRIWSYLPGSWQRWVLRCLETKPDVSSEPNQE